ncbi:MAG: hypothetical protein TR69_WS6001000949 [candidate division WS6 bacterium OLB20]|uniref:Lycopene cyclase domain-containing protein n=1 Tax=candidate division WS6 bacterium OLB20 TaxID=1617426 RepID=A0A136LZ47_9BACT|nr:MAG: hypothetical protein TR69_WS6001000949 [candidate division WS6 bacterium OLB20]
MEYTYLLINLAILAGPLLLSFDPRVRYYRRWPAVFAAILTVSSAMVFWDIHATAAGHWFFSDAHTIGIRFAGLPLEELLFFVTVPFACLFTWEVVQFYLKKDELLRGMLPLWRIAGIAFMLAGFAAGSRQYTAWVLFLCGGLITILTIFKPEVLIRRSSLIWIGVTAMLFLLFNTVLTAVPVVTYGEDMVSGIRIGTIPLEDSFYNLFMLLAYLTLYLRFRRAPAGNPVQPAS